MEYGNNSKSAYKEQSSSSSNDGVKLIELGQLWRSNSSENKSGFIFIASKVGYMKTNVESKSFNDSVLWKCITSNGKINVYPDYFILSYYEIMNHSKAEKENE